MKCEDAKRCVLNLIGGQYVERWPESEAHAFFHKQELSYDDRLVLGTFLYGNLRDADLVYCALLEQLGADAKNHDRMRRWLADLASGKYDDRVYYWEVIHAPDFYFLSGACNLARTPPQPFVRCMHAWERECARMWRQEGRWPTLAEQRAALGM
jgi:hypothetical protein